MKGKIIKYIEEKGYGFILDEEGSKRFFHISDTVTPLEIAEQQFVEFEPGETEKGLISKQISITDSQNKSGFIKLYGTNIKASNIKQFGISEGEEKSYKARARGLFSKVKTYDSIEEVLEAQNLTAVTNAFGEKVADYETVISTYHYLYVTTYQGDNFSWVDSLDELEKNLKSIEEALS